jgi:hypothetical protein
MMQHSGISCRGNDYSRHCEERSDDVSAVAQRAKAEAIQTISTYTFLDCFAEPVIGPRIRADPLARNDGEAV